MFTNQPKFTFFVNSHLIGESILISQKILIINKLGLHARAAAKFVTVAGQFESDIQLKRATRAVNGKSIMGIMLLAASKGTELEIIIDGNDEDQAMQQLIQLVENKFDESE